tara:strand:- start:95 stop:562 length:468 start_codon:yes stop_codon:yes gene_type:complete
MSYKYNFERRNKFRVSEGKLVSLLKSKGIAHSRYGVDALDSKLPWWHVPQFVRSAPDYIVFPKEKKAPFFVESKSLKGTVKLKKRDIKCYKAWNQHLPVVFFIYDIDRKLYTKITLDTLLKVIVDVPVKIFDNNPDKEYYDIPTNVLPEFKELSG